MYLFAILLLPLIVAYQLINERYFTKPLWEIASALFLGIPTVFVLQVLRVLIFPINWGFPFQVILSVWLFDFLIPSILGCYFFVELLRHKLVSSGRMGTLWFSSYFFLIVTVKMIYANNHYGLYELFYYPIIFACFAFLFPLWLSRRYGHFFWNAFWGTALAMWSTVFPTIIAASYYMSRPTVSFVSFILYITLVANILFFTRGKTGSIPQEGRAR